MPRTFENQVGRNSFSPVENNIETFYLRTCVRSKYVYRKTPFNYGRLHYSLIHTHVNTAGTIPLMVCDYFKYVNKQVGLPRKQMIVDRI